MCNYFIRALASTASFFMLSSIALADCGKVSITEMNWTSSQIITEVAKFIMEKGYSCKVKKVPSDTNKAMKSLVETGQPDIITELWINSLPQYDELKKEGKVKTATEVLSDGGVQGWWIPKYLADRHPELTTIDDIIENPALVGNTFHNCPIGWSCRKINDNLIQALGLDEKMKIFNHTSRETLATSLSKAYADKKPWFGYYWAPTAALGKYPMVKISIGQYKSEIHTCNSKGQQCRVPDISEYPTGQVITAVTSEIAQKNPAIFKLMSNLSLTNAQMGDILAWKEANKASTEQAADYFIKKYENIWSKWINDDASRKLSVRPK